MQKYLQENSFRTQAQLKNLGYVKGDVTAADETTRVFAAANPEDILIVKAGGNSGIYSELIMNYYGLVAQTALITEPKS